MVAAGGTCTHVSDSRDSDPGGLHHSLFCHHIHVMHSNQLCTAQKIYVKRFEANNLSKNCVRKHWVCTWFFFLKVKKVCFVFVITRVWYKTEHTLDKWIYYFRCLHLVLVQHLAVSPHLHSGPHLHSSPAQHSFPMKMNKNKKILTAKFWIISQHIAIFSWSLCWTQMDNFIKRHFSWLTKIAQDSSR